MSRSQFEQWLINNYYQESALPNQWFSTKFYCRICLERDGVYLIKAWEIPPKYIGNYVFAKEYLESLMEDYIIANI